MKNIKKIIGFFLIAFLLISTIQLQPAYAKSRIEIVFIIDQSGSMGDDINNVKRNIGNFVDLMVAQGIDYRLGLITYETHCKKYNLTSSVNTFRNNLSNVNTFGGTENGLDAIMTAINSYTFYENAAKYFIIIGDEPITSRHGYSHKSVSNILNNKDITLTGIGHSTFNYLVNATDGLKLDLGGSFSNQLTTIFEDIQKIPIIDILKPLNNQWVPGTKGFNPRIKVTDPDSDTLTIKCFIDNATTPHYEVDVPNTKTAIVVDIQQIDLAQLSEGNHKLKFTVYDQCDTVQDIVNFKIDKTGPQINISQTNTTENSINLTMTAQDNGSGLAAKPYKINIDDNAAVFTNNNQATKTNLLPNTGYNVVLEAIDNASNISTLQKTIYTAAEKPVLDIDTVSKDTLSIVVKDNNPSVTEYLVKVNNQYLANDGSLTNNESWITFINKSKTIKGLQQNKAYTIVAKAKNHNGEITPLSRAINITTLAEPPAFTDHEKTQESITLYWNKITGAQFYEIKDANGITNINPNNNTHTFSGLEANTPYSFWIRTVNSSGAGNWSEVINISTLPYPPTKVENITVTDYSQTSMQLTWSSATRATYYEVKIDEQEPIVCNDTSITINDLVPETEYQVTVRAINIGGKGEYSDVLIQSTLPNPPAVPQNLTTQITKNSVFLTWTPVEKAEGYYIKIDGSTKIDVGTETSYLHEGLEPISGHSYQVKATRANGKVEGDWSEQVDVTTHPEKPIAPKNILTTSDTESITVTWYDVPYAEKYYVCIDDNVIKEIKGTMFIHKNIKPDEEHSYKLQAENITGKSEWSNPVSSRTLPVEDENETISLTNVMAVVTNDSINISWDTVAYKAEYEIEVDGVLQDIGTDTSFEHLALTQNEYHTYKIRVKSLNNSSKWCGVLSLSTLPDPPETPKNVEAIATYNSIELKWDKVNSAEAYEIEIDGNSIIATELNKYIHTPLEPGTSHIYRVRSKGQAGITAWSSAVIISTENPNYLINCEQGETFELSIIVDNVQDFGDITFNMEYDTAELEIVDLCGFTPQKDTESGPIKNTNLIVTKQDSQVSIKVNKNIIPGKSWSGEITTIVFKPKITGQATINLNIKEK
ncbi:fibronectin type III domain-containing protein [Clostridium sp. 'deep sea']|uniref:fibronectin type III domain-containing protein n=1 Tax=Clostridium sp. 'deep sea' TaxID=2779445 RepID=UPI0018963FC6|nr:fibronectin type III domain-containing protein [Clostridium sp. 'deep sea']QOR35898.1 fibronectin type III domain-containing protein [Clostridium sp. 'deep sea']